MCLAGHPRKVLMSGIIGGSVILAFHGFGLLRSLGRG